MEQDDDDDDDEHWHVFLMSLQAVSHHDACWECVVFCWKRVRQQEHIGKEAEETSSTAKLWSHDDERYLCVCACV